MKEDLTFDTIPAKFCGMVEEYRLELAKKSGIDLQLDVSLPGKTIFGIHETVLISKNFGFIEWLVDNDKIDRDKLKEEREDLCDVNLRHLRNKYIDVVSLSYVKLLMLLSIQDNPIEFLVSILK